MNNWFLNLMKDFHTDETQRYFLSALFILTILIILTKIWMIYLFEFNIKKCKNKPVQKTTEEICKELYNATKKSKTSISMKQRAISLTNECPRAINIQMAPNGYTPFLKACFIGNEELINLMIKKGADINITDTRGDGPFFLAVNSICVDKTNDFYILKVLLNAGCQINKCKNNGYTALHLAAYYGHDSLVKWMLVHGADPYPNTLKDSPYLVANKYGHPSTAALLYVNIGQNKVSMNSSQIDYSL